MKIKVGDKIDEIELPDTMVICLSYQAPKKKKCY